MSMNKMSEQKIVVCEDFRESLSGILSSLSYDQLFVLVDEHTSACCLPLLSGVVEADAPVVLRIGAGDAHKTLETDLRYGKRLKNYILKQGFGRRIPHITISGTFIFM